MRRIGSLALASGCLVLATGLALAQHTGHTGHGAHDQQGAAAGHAAPPADTRQFVTFPPAMVAHTFANMRDHLAALQEINSALSQGKNADAAKIAEERLGMSSLGLHGAHEASTFMPQGMQEAGTAMHRAASRFAIAAQDAAVTGELKPALAGLSEVMAACVTCHAAYRLK